MRVAASLPLTLPLLLLLLLAGCALERTSLAPADNRVTGGGVLAVWADRIGEGEEQFDLHLVLQNISKKSILVFARDISGARGDSPGKAGFPIFGIGERTIDMGPGQVKSVTLSFRHGPAKGDFRITVNRVFANPSDDRRTPGEVIATDVEWVLPESAAK